tara:strand:- start:1295 stop:2065 length:771 start_codon:yes stop_codon:yes gene_type:complete
MGLTFRTGSDGKGSALTIDQLDDNFRYFTGSHSVTGSFIVSGSLEVEGSITASGNISSSGEGRFQSLGINYGGNLSTGSAGSDVALRVDGNTRIDRGYFLVINSSSLNEYLYYKNENKALYISTTSSNLPIDPQLSFVFDGKVSAGFGYDDENEDREAFIANYTLFTASLSPSSSIGGIALATSASDGTVDRLRVSQLGNVGIGTRTPSERLEVSGNISASGFIQSDSLVLTSPNGTKYRFTTNNDGHLSLTGSAI